MGICPRGFRLEVDSAMKSYASLARLGFFAALCAAIGMPPGGDGTLGIRAVGAHEPPLLEPPLLGPMLPEPGPDCPEPLPPVVKVRVRVPAVAGPREPI